MPSSYQYPEMYQEVNPIQIVQQLSPKQLPTTDMVPRNFSMHAEYNSSVHKLKTQMDDQDMQRFRENLNESMGENTDKPKHLVSLVNQGINYNYNYIYITI